MQKYIFFTITAVLCALQTIQADDYTWTALSGTNSFQTTSNWSPAGLPGLDDTAQFTTDGSYGVSFAEDATNTSATIGADVTFNLNGKEWNLMDGLGFPYTGTATASFNEGSLISDGTDALTIRSGQKLILNSGSTYFRHTVSTSSGILEVNGGDHILNMGLSPSTAPADDMSFRMTGGSVTLTNSDNGARFVLQGGSKASLEGGIISVKQVMDTYGSYTAPSIIDIYTNATLIFPTSGINFARQGGGSSFMNIRGGSVLLSNGTFTVVNTAYNKHLLTTGIVSLIDGVLHARNLNLAEKSNSVAIVEQSAGELTIPGTFNIGRNRNTRGIFTQSGGRATFNTVNVGASSIDATNTHGEICLTDGTLWGNSFYVGASGDGTSGEIYLSGGSLITPGALNIGNADGAFGRVIQSGGSLTVSNRINVGSYAGGFGQMVIDGSPLFIRDGFYIGAAAGSTGELVITGGTYIQPGGMNLGIQADSVAKIHIDGGELVVSNALNIGSSSGARGALQLTEGKLLSMGSVNGIQVGNTSGSIGELIVDGGIVIATNKYALFAGASQGSRGTVTINGGVVDVRSMRIGHWHDCYGMLRITGGHTYVTNDVNFNCVFGNVL
jgi:hypothetical protein